MNPSNARLAYPHLFELSDEKRIELAEALSDSIAEDKKNDDTPLPEAVDLRNH
jgi:hypothetical protein